MTFHGFPSPRSGTRVRVFVDRCLTPAFAEALNKSPEITACHLRDVYGETPGHFVPDTQWLKDCGEAGWIAITQNFKIGHVPSEVDAITAAGTKVFSLSRANLPPHEQGLVVGRYLLRMIRRARREDGCFWRIHLERTWKDLV